MPELQKILVIPSVSQCYKIKSHEGDINKQSAHTLQLFIMAM